MQSLLKAVVAAVTFGIVVAGAVIFYVEHKIDQVTEAVVAPIAETRDRVDGALEGVERSVTSVVESGTDVVDDVVSTVDDVSDIVDSTVTASSKRVQSLGEGVTAIIQSSADQAERTMRHGTEAVREFWDSTGSRLIESWDG
jgi:phage-related protein